MNRRDFARRLAALTPLLPAGLRAAETRSARRMTIDLTPGAVGISADLPGAMRLAQQHGFESVQPDGSYLARLDDDGRARVSATLRERGLRWGAAGLSVEFRQSEEAFRNDMRLLPATAAALKAVEASRVGTWIRPGHAELEYAANLEIHARRLREVARVLRDHGLRLGLEYVGTPSLRARVRHPFVHTLSQARDLVRAIDVPETGLVLDSWHWWTAGDTVEAVRGLRNADVVAVDLNDAPAGVPLADQMDNRRELPLATGVIPVRGFLQALFDIGYDGPVRAEPFNGPLNQLDDDDAAARVVASLRSAMALVDPPAR